MHVRTGLILLGCCVLLCFLTSSGIALEMRAYQMREDFGSEPVLNCALRYYYYVPCPTYSWFWAVSGWTPGEIIGMVFQTDDLPLGGLEECVLNGYDLYPEYLRVLDFAGYGTLYPGQFTVEFDIYCGDEQYCGVQHLWNSGPTETHFGWNLIEINDGSGHPPAIHNCRIDPGDEESPHKLWVTATHTGTDGVYPRWGLDNIGTPQQAGCVLHDTGCLPVLAPRPQYSHHSTMHSGYYGYYPGQICPSQWFKDGLDSTPDAAIYGYVELAWTLYFYQSGPG